MENNNTNKLLSIFKDMIVKYGKNEMTLVINEIITIKTHAILKSFKEMDMEVDKDNKETVQALLPDLVMFFDIKCKILEVEETFISEDTLKDLKTWSDDNNIEIELEEKFNRVTNLVLIMDIFSNDILTLLNEVKSHENK